jgi:MFS family permease
MAISTAMPSVAKDLDAVRSYGLAFSVLLTAEMLGIVLAGVWSDRRGPLPPLFAGQVLYGCRFGAGRACPDVHHPVSRTADRRPGLRLIVVALYVVIGRAYPDALRPKVFSWVSAAWVLPSLIGPPIAGWLASTWSWRWVFLIVLAPIAVTLTVVSTQRERIGGGSTADQSGPSDLSRHRRLALLGLGVAISAGAMQWGADQLVPVHALPVTLATLGLIGVAVTAPRLVPSGTLRMSRGLPAVISSRFLLTASFNGALTFIPLMLVNERHLGLTTTGIILTVGALGWSSGSFIQGHGVMHDRRSELVVAGGASLTVGILLLCRDRRVRLALLPDGASHCPVRTGDGSGDVVDLGALTGPLARQRPRPHLVVAAALRRARQRHGHLGGRRGVHGHAQPRRLGHPRVRTHLVSMAAVAALVMVGGQQTRT